MATTSLNFKIFKQARFKQLLSCGRRATQLSMCLNTSRVEVLPPLEADMLLDMMRHKSTQLEAPCRSMSGEQLELFTKRFAELSHTNTLADDRVIMNRVINTSLMKTQMARTAQSTKYKTPAVATAEPVSRPHGWGWHQRVCDLQSSADNIDLAFACWPVPWSGSPELARAMTSKLLFDFSFPILVLTDYRFCLTVFPKYVSKYLTCRGIPSA